MNQLASLIKDGVVAKSSTMIGDRALDIVAAKSNALASVGVLWGHGSLEELQAVAPDASLRHPHELLRFAHAG